MKTTSITVDKKKTKCSNFYRWFPFTVIIVWSHHSWFILQYDTHPLILNYKKKKYIYCIDTLMVAYSQPIVWNFHNFLEVTGFNFKFGCPYLLWAQAASIHLLLGWRGGLANRYPQATNNWAAGQKGWGVEGNHSLNLFPKWMTLT